MEQQKNNVQLNFLKANEWVNQIVEIGRKLI